MRRSTPWDMRLLIAVFFVLLGDLSAEPSGRIVIDLDGIETARGGSILVALFNKADQFPSGAGAFRKLKLVPGRGVSGVFDNLPEGEYAVSVVHDVNGNEKMDMKWLPFPHPGEGYAISNNATGVMGPPKFSDAKFTVAGEVRLQLTLKY